ncbi:MAG TPA: hypothetical protein PLC54_07805 [Spirochaetales bacterium]|nr:hypothetical protein [Spirochaetales bacterium]
MSLLQRVLSASLVSLAASAPLVLVYILSWRLWARHMDALGQRRFMRRALWVLAIGFGCTFCLSLFRGRVAISGVLAVLLTILVGKSIFSRSFQPKAKASSLTSWDSTGTDSTS